MHVEASIIKQYQFKSIESFAWFQKLLYKGVIKNKVYTDGSATPGFRKVPNLNNLKKKIIEEQ